jgi:transcriptional regulator GlxA family with amidase domain
VVGVRGERVDLGGTSGKAPATREARRAIFEEAAAIVRSEYASDLRPDTVARRVATSRRQLQRVFAEVGGTTFAAYLTRVRLDRAAALLRDDPSPVPQIARAVGFRSPSGFTVAFRRHHGVPPGAIRGASRSGTRERDPEQVAAGVERAGA